YYHLDRSPNFKVLYLDYAAVVENPRREAARINAFLGGKLDVEAMAGAVAADLCRNRQPAARHV
ncbi:MAG TPA: nucleotide pyrophosphatase, partial [Methylomirabilota bacterium]|nr:nucleotide pyrophosphatase [Methylomirabilota bacterium]